MSWRRKSETDEALHESIMEATARAIVKHGVSNLTVRDIGAEFDRSRSLINYHYNSKQELLETFVEYTAERYSRGLTPDPDVRADIQLDRFVQQSLFGRNDAENAETHWILFAAQYALRPEAMVNEQMEQVLRGSFMEVHRTLSAIIADGIEQGVVEADDPELVAALILGVIDSARGGKIILGDETAPERLYLALTEFIYPTLGIEPSE